MKKILVALLITVSATSAMAYYVKLGVGLNEMTPISINQQEFTGKIKLKQSFPSIEAAIGYNWFDDLRTELALNYNFVFHPIENSLDKAQNNYVITHTAKADALMINAYKDLFTYNNVTPFIGGGIGASRIRNGAVGYQYAENDSTYYRLAKADIKHVQKFAYKLTGGVSFQLCDGVSGEIVYNFFDLGNNKARVGVFKHKYLIHNATFGIKMDL